MRPLFALVAGLWLAGSGCSSDPDAENDALDGDDHMDDCSEYAEPLDFVLLDDAANFTWGGTLEVSVYEVAEHSDMRIEWSQLTHDTMQQPLDPAADIETAGLLVFPALDHDDVIQGINTNDIHQADVGLYPITEVTGTSHAFLADVDVETYFDDGYGATWFVTLGPGESLGTSMRSCAILDPSPTSQASEALIDDDSCVVHPDADLSSLSSPTAAECAPLHFDWSNLTTDGFGGNLNIDTIDGLILSYHAGDTPADLGQTLAITGEDATEVWTLAFEAGATSALLDGHPSAAGIPFDGIAGGGAWLLALTCSTCSSPVPPFATVLTIGG